MAILYKNTPDKEGIETNTHTHTLVATWIPIYKNTPDKEGIETYEGPHKPSRNSSLYKNTPDKEGIETYVRYL